MTEPGRRALHSVTAALPDTATRTGDVAERPTGHVESRNPVEAVSADAHSVGTATGGVDSAVGAGDTSDMASDEASDLACDLALIGTWQRVRAAINAVDSRLSCALASADAPGALVHEALAVLAAAPRQMLPMSELAEVLGLTTGSVTKLVDRLVAANLTRRQHSSTDRRVVLATLTDEGAAHELLSTGQYAQQLRIELSVLGTARLTQLQDIATVLRAQTTTPAGNPPADPFRSTPAGGSLARTAATGPPRDQMGSLRPTVAHHARRSLGRRSEPASEHGPDPDWVWERG